MSKRRTAKCKKVRTMWNEEKQQWYFVISDVVQILTKTFDPYDYIKKIRKNDRGLTKSWKKIVAPLEVETKGGRQYINCASAPGLTQIILAIPSPKVSAFKEWLESLNIDNSNKIKIYKNSLKAFHGILKNSNKWIEKRDKYVMINQRLPVAKRMNELEIIYTLLKENDLAQPASAPASRRSTTPKKVKG